LAAVLQKLLAVGNVMNEGTYQGSAAGFTLDSLLKLTTTKGVDKKTSVLDIVTRMLGEQGNTEMLDFPEELRDLQEASRYNPAEISREIQVATRLYERVSKSIHVCSVKVYMCAL
jgi:hypothetical protein